MKTLVILLLAMSLQALAILGDEDNLLAAHPAVFRSSPEQLCIVTAERDTVRFLNQSDSKSGLGNCSFHLIDFFPDINFWGVEMHGYEWMEWYAVSGATGETTTTIGPLKPSPDGERILCAMEDITAGFIYNGIQIWNINPDGSLTLEFENVDVPWGPVNAGWADERTVVFRKLAYLEGTYEEFIRPGKLKLNDQGVWEPSNPDEWLWE